MAECVLVDSSVFIELLRARLDPARELSAWAGDRDLATCGMVRVEVLRGVKTPGAHRALSAFMDVMLNVPTDNQLWVETANLAWMMDRRGDVIPATDVIIAASALRIGASVLSYDGHFKKVPGLTLRTEM